MAANKGSLDTNVLLRWLGDDEPDLSKQVDRLLGAGGSFRVSDVAILEVVYVLERNYGYSREDVALNIGLLLANSQFLCNRILLDRALARYLEHPKLSFADCYLAAEAKLAQAAPLYTFDRKLSRQSDGAAKLLQ